VCASLAGILSLNFFFLPPLGTFAIRDPANWIAFIAFMLTAVTVGQLSGSAKQRAEDAENAKREVERLYYELQDSFERSSQAKALKQSERLKSALLDAVTHDFRTPLTSIKASATAMLDDLYATERDHAEPVLDLEADQPARCEIGAVLVELRRRAVDPAAAMKKQNARQQPFRKARRRKYPKHDGPIIHRHQHIANAADVRGARRIDQFRQGDKRPAAVAHILIAATALPGRCQHFQEAAGVAI